MFRGKAKQAKLIRKNSVKFRQIGSIYDIMEMSMFGRKIYVLFFFFFDVIFIWLQWMSVINDNHKGLFLKRQACSFVDYGIA